jgi:hypothetical protein
MSWAYKEKPEMTERLAEHIRAGNANKRLVIPACHLRARSKSGLILSFTSPTRAIHL